VPCAHLSKLSDHLTLLPSSADPAASSICSGELWVVDIAVEDLDTSNLDGPIVDQVGCH